MNSITEHSIRQQLTKLIEHDITLSEFRQWFFTEVYDAEHSIAYDHGDWIDDEMMINFRAVLAD